LYTQRLADICRYYHTNHSQHENRCEVTVY
jgi:hypothetical protein